MCITFPNSSRLVKNIPLRVVFSTLFSVFGNVMKHSLECLIGYILSVLAANENGVGQDLIAKRHLNP